MKVCSKCFKKMCECENPPEFWTHVEVPDTNDQGRKDPGRCPHDVLNYQECYLCTPDQGRKGPIVQTRDGVKQDGKLLSGPYVEPDAPPEWPIKYVRTCDMHDKSITRDKMPMVSVGALNWLQDQNRDLTKELSFAQSVGIEYGKTIDGLASELTAAQAQLGKEQDDYQKLWEKWSAAQARIAELEQDHKDDMREYGTMLSELAAAKAEIDQLIFDKLKPASTIGKLRKELDEQCRLNGMGQERELKLMTELAAAKYDLELAQKEFNSKQAKKNSEYDDEKLAQAKARIKDLETESAANFNSAESWKEQALEKFELIDAIADAKEREQKLVAALRDVAADSPDESKAEARLTDQHLAKQALKAHRGEG